MYCMTLKVMACILEIKRTSPHEFCPNSTIDFYYCNMYIYTYSIFKSAVDANEISRMAAISFTVDSNEISRMAAISFTVDSNEISRMAAISFTG
jgi:hypothetical protein